MAADQHPAADFTARLVEIQRPLFTYVMALWPQAAHAEEILQNTNRTILANRHRWAEVQDFDGWARRLAWFEYLAHRKQVGRERRRSESAELLGAVADEAFDRAIDGDRLVVLERCLGRLPKGERALVDARYGRPASLEELARETRRTIGSVRQLLYRIRRALLACIERELAGEAGR